MLPDDDQEDPPRPDDRRRRTGCRSSISSTRRASSCRCRTRSFPTRTISGGSSATTRCSRRAGIPQYAAIMGNCVAGGAYLPVLCDTVLMTEGSGLYLAGPALVKAAIGQEISHEELGGAHVHAAISGTVDYREPDDDACLARLRRLIALLASRPEPPARAAITIEPPARPADDLYTLVSSDPSAQYDVRDLLAAILDGGRLDEYRPEYGRTLVCGFGQLGGNPLGIVATQRLRFRPEGGGPFQFGGVIYADSADKAARFVLECNQSRLPILFIQDVNGFDVGRDAERTGIIRRGAKLVSAVSNSTVPKITLIVGHSFGAGHYALCGKAFDPAVHLRLAGRAICRHGRQQAARTMLDVNVGTLKRQGKQIDDAELAGHGRRAAPAVRSRDRHSLRGRAALGRRDHRPRPDARGPDPGLSTWPCGTESLKPVCTGVFQV